MFVTAIVTYAILIVQRYGFRSPEHIIGSLVCLNESRTGCG